MGWIKRKGDSSAVGDDEPAPGEERTPPARTPPVAPSQSDDEKVEVGVAAADSDKRGGAEPSIISYGVEISGRLRSDGPIHVEGRIEGSLESDEVSIGTTGVVMGEIHALQLSVHGELEGEGICEKLTMGPSASYRGSLDCESLELASGGILVGKVRVGPT